MKITVGELIQIVQDAQMVHDTIDKHWHTEPGTPEHAAKGEIIGACYRLGSFGDRVKREAEITVKG